MPDIKDAKRQVHDALTAAGAMPQWELVATAQFLDQPEILRLRVDGGHLYVYGTAMTFAARSAQDEEVLVSEQNAEEWFMQMNEAQAERDAARQQIHRLEEENGRLRGEVELLQRERDSARRQLAEKQRQVEDWEAEALKYLKYHQQARNLEAALSHAREERTAARVAANEAKDEAALVRATLDATQADLGQARQAADDWAATAREYERWRDEALKMVAELTTERNVLAAQLAKEREAADKQAPVGGLLCPRSKAKQFGTATYVMRRCKLQDGHDGQCDPA